MTAFDFTSPERRENIRHVITQLLSLGIVPIINENDAVSANQGYAILKYFYTSIFLAVTRYLFPSLPLFRYQLYGNSFSDNDSLASMVAVEMGANLLILLTDVEGVYDRPPKDPEAKLIDVFSVETGFEVGEKSLQGRGGMGAKVSSALNAAHGGVQAVIIAAGWKGGIIESIMRGEKVGTLFLHNTDGAALDPAAASTILADSKDDHIQGIAKSARDGGRQLQALSSQERSAILETLAEMLSARSTDILAANEMDLEIAKASKISLQMLKRLKLTSEKISTLVDGIRAIAAQEEPLGQVCYKKKKKSKY